MGRLGGGIGGPSTSHGRYAPAERSWLGRHVHDYLPRSEDLAAVRPGRTLPGSRIMGAGACVLVVEDNEAVGQFSTEILHDLGYETTGASNASDALALLRNPANRFQLVFTEVIMPGMNGIDFAKEVRRRLPDIRCC